MCVNWFQTITFTAIWQINHWPRKMSKNVHLYCIIVLSYLEYVYCSNEVLPGGYRTAGIRLVLKPCRKPTYARLMPNIWFLTTGPVVFDMSCECASVYSLWRLRLYSVAYAGGGVIVISAASFFLWALNCRANLFSNPKRKFAHLKNTYLHKTDPILGYNAWSWNHSKCVTSVTKTTTDIENPAAVI